MKFNEELTSKIEEKDQPLAELILFTCDRGMNLYHFVEVDEGRIVFAHHLFEEVQRVTALLLENNILIPDYPSKLVRLSPVKSLYLTETTTTDFDINRLRKYFPNASKGDPTTCKNRLKAWFAEHPDKTMEDVETATRLYSEDCNRTGRLFKDAHNFIKDDNEVSLLSAWISTDLTQTDLDEFI